MAHRDESSEDEKPLKKRKLNARSQSQTADEEQRRHPDGNVEVSGIALPSLEGEARRHPTLWFSDGLVTVIAADGVIFKLHSGLLARRSEVLKEHIAALSPLGNPQSGAVLAIGTHQEITLSLSENGDDLSELFDMIYDGKTQNMYYNLETRITFSHFYRILRLGVKYKVQQIVESGFARLEQAFPSDFDAWISSDKTFYEATCPIEMKIEDTVAFVPLARDAKRIQSLPVMLYACTAEIDSACLLQGLSYSFETLKLDIADQLTCVDARRRLQEIEAGTTEIFLEMAFDGPAAQCTARQACIAECRYLILRALRNNVLDGRVFSGWDEWIDDIEEIEGRQKLCSACKEHLKSQIRKHARTQWDKLGEIFNVPDWTPPKKLA